MHEQTDELTWACTILSLQNNIILPTTTIVKTPWSEVTRVNTTGGVFYVKTTPADFAQEALILQYLDKQQLANVPPVIAHNSECDTFIMQDAGECLRHVLQQQFSKDNLYNAADMFIDMQLKSQKHIDALLDLGVPDYRSAELAKQYTKIVSDKTLHETEALTPQEISILQSQIPAVNQLCEQHPLLEAHATIVQPDFSDNNMLIHPETGVMTLVDLGEIVISNPLFSLFNAFNKIKQLYSEEMSEHEQKKWQQYCLKRITCGRSNTEEIQKAVRHAEKLFPIYLCVNQYLFTQACGREKLIKFGHHKLDKQLRWLASTTT